ncbi:hypothetical protein [Citreimonas salinaria]|uniref:Uncharacterized protein n=1 Tax=Citreimonas salinaria TaxID=321339 RepID=A0A1H3KTU7_9RHOB|nr:hypothetical protein [Citreimonas salinaria]SDY55084.1 hypothetical protein SAMN05444340_11082 [Citreimonas salinaria]
MKSLIAAFVVTLFATSAIAQSGCVPHADAMEVRAGTHSEERIGMGLSANGTLMEIWANHDTGTWTILRVLPSGIACIAELGSHFMLYEVTPGGAPT